MNDFDAIVIGSGAGGLTAALALQQAGKRTLVLEQHYLPGGWCHSFDLGGYRFSPGVHYIGEVGPGGRMRRIYEGLGVSADLEMIELNPDGFDHVLIGGGMKDGPARFDIPRGKQTFADRLKSRFPGEAAGIDRFLDVTEGLSRELGTMLRMGLLDMVLLPLKAPTIARWGFSSLGSLLDATVRDPRLRAILAAQCGDHGLPPSMAPAPLHCATAAHYFDGGYYPRGGGAAIPRAFIRALKRAGGQIRVRAGVDRILTEKAGFMKRRAIGVRLADGTELRAPLVVSNADPDLTFRRLVGTEHLSWRLRLKLATTRYSVSSLSLFLAVDMDVRAAGLDSGNVWWYESDDIEGTYQASRDPRAMERPELPGFFLTATTLKDPSKLGHSFDRTTGARRAHHTLEMFTLVPDEAFARWAGSKHDARPADYAALKRDLEARMLRSLEKVLPGVREKVVFSSLGTPLTNRHYVASSFGNLYGTEKSRFQVGPFSYPIRTELDGLLLCGASTVSHGVFGATLSGLMAAARGLKCRTDELLRPGGVPLKTYSAENPAEWPEDLRRRVAEAAAPPPAAVPAARREAVPVG